MSRKRVAQGQNLNKTNENYELIVNFLKKYRLPIFIILGIIAVGLIAFGTISYVNTQNTEKANSMYDISLNMINNLNYIQDANERNTYYNQAITMMNNLITLYPKSVASMRARLFLARLLFDDALRNSKAESLQSAVQIYSDVFNLSDSHYYKSLALLGRAQCLEQTGQYDLAVTDYKNVVIYSDEMYSPLAIIGMARCMELKNDMTSAMGYYKRIVQNYTNSGWYNYAKGKLLLNGISVN